jgi:hypothetical protein
MSNLNELFDPYMQAMFGTNYIRLPLNFIVQAVDDNKIVAIAQTGMGNAMKYNSKMIHQLVCGEAIIRPHMVMESNHLVGHGLAAIARDGFSPDEWLDKGKFIIKPKV